MRPWASFACTAAAVAVTYASGPPAAVRLTIAEPAFYDVTVERVETGAPGFRIALSRDMPTPGWKLDVDGVEIDDEAGRIVVRVTEQAPEGMAAQVITPTPLAIPLEPLVRGTYTLEIRMRRGRGGAYDPVHAMVLRAF